MNIASGSLTNQFRRISFPQDRVAALCLATISGVILFGLTAAWPSPTYDGIVHFHRIRAVADALRAGVIFPRWFPDFAYGYGFPVLNYYAPGFYYPPALLHLAGLDMVASVRFSLTIGFALSAWWMFHLSRLYVSLWPAIVSVVCFQFFPYRMIDFFERGAFPEFSAFIWLPLIAYYTVQAVTVHRRTEKRAGAESKSGAQGASPLLAMLAKAGLAWAALIVTHNLTAMMAALVLGAALALITLLRYRERAGVYRIAGIGVAALAIGILVSAWYILPALLEIHWVILSQGFALGEYLNILVGWRELIEFDLIYTYFDPDSPTISLPIYTIPIGIAAPIAVVAVQSRKLRLFTLVTLLLTLGVVWMTTSSSAWVWTSGEVLLEKLQFPTRWQVFAAFGTALLSAASLEPLRKVRRLPAFAVPLVGVVLSAYLLANALGRLDYPADDVSSYNEASAISLWRRDLLTVWGISATEFLPIWVTEQPWAIGREPGEPRPIVDIIDFAAVAPTRTGLLQQQFQVTTQQPFRLLFHQFYVPAWRIALDGVRVDAQPATNLALASVTVPPGTHTVELEWGATRAVWLGRVLTAFGWVVVFVLLLKAGNGSGILRPRRDSDRPTGRRHWPLVVWLAAGAFMVAAASGITARTWDVEAIGADYGNIRLEGVRPPRPTRAGDVAPVQLTWFVKDYGTPVSAFVHLVDEVGAVIAQDDGPLGGAYTPYSRWSPGLILHSTHYITVPASLPPGNYRLIAGLYYPATPLEPLVPMNADSPRLEIGMLKVLP